MIDTAAIRWYPSKVDWWLPPVLALPIVAALGVCFSSIQYQSLASGLIGGIVLILVLGLYIGFIFPVRYGISASELILAFGRCRKSLPLSSIIEVAPTNNPLSAPALSFQRLRIQYRTGLLGYALISPREREAFLDELALGAGLIRSGDRLIRANCASADGITPE
jgi:hypothetical protein